MGFSEHVTSQRRHSDLAQEIVPARRHDRDFWYTMVGQFGPIAAQLGMMLLMLVEGRWIYAAVFLPSLIASCALSLGSLSRQFRPAEQPPESSLSAASSQPAHGETALTATDITQLFAGVAEQDLESCLLPETDLDTDRAPWRSIVHQWVLQSSQAANYDATLGSSLEGRFHLNLPLQGPHALIAGTTGSGKSVLLEDWCLSLACKLPPSRLNFCFLDFKGGSACNQLKNLPHTVGCVSDLDLEHAKRALVGIEHELKRREQLLAQAQLWQIDDLPDPPARLFIVIDEFQALRQQLPDFMDHLVQLASLGRSLGMNLIACTQNPMSQVSDHMKANMNLNLCLRVREPMQSKELLGSDWAAKLSPQQPGTGFYNDGECTRAFRCASCSHPDLLVRSIRTAAKFVSSDWPQPLFSAPLPTRLIGQDTHELANGSHLDSSGIPLVAIGLGDDGVRVSPARLAVSGNIAIIGGPGRGKSTCLHTIYRQLLELSKTQGLAYSRIDYTQVHEHSFETRTVSADGLARHADAHDEGQPDSSSAHTLWILDGADQLLDPLNTDPLAEQLRQALTEHRADVIMTLLSARHLRNPELFQAQIIFPSGDKGTDFMAGLNSEILTKLGRQAGQIPGRAALVTGGMAQPIQCALWENS